MTLKYVLVMNYKRKKKLYINRKYKNFYCIENLCWAKGINNIISKSNSNKIFTIQMFTFVCYVKLKYIKSNF